MPNELDPLAQYEQNMAKMQQPPPQPDQSKIMEFIIQMLRNPMTSMKQGVPPPGQIDPTAMPPMPNAMGQGGGFNPGNRPGMNQPGM